MYRVHYYEAGTKKHLHGATTAPLPRELADRLAEQVALDHPGLFGLSLPEKDDGSFGQSMPTEGK